MRIVTRFEADLLQILHGLFGRVPAGHFTHFVARPHEAPIGLTRDAVELIQDALSKGTVRLLASAGSARERFVRGERTVEGRVWERTPVAQLALRFSPHSLDLLRWLAATELSDGRAVWRPTSAAPLETGDRWLMFLTLRALCGSNYLRGSLNSTPWMDHALLRLTWPGEFVEATKNRPPVRSAEEKSSPSLDFAPWLAPPGIAILEAWQHELADELVALERSKGRIRKPESMRALGEEQSRVYEAYLDAIDRAGRRDLARWFLIAAQRLFASDTGGAPALENWVGSLEMLDLRLADREAAYDAALALPRLLERLSGWQREARQVGYVDEGYAAAQLWKSDWERYNGDASYRAARTLRERTTFML